RILVTSQQSLGVAGETIWRVTALTLPPPAEGTLLPEALDRLEQSDAVQLFLQRARAVQPDFALNASTVASVVAICRELDGLPLGIELAAARLRVLPVADIRSRLNDRFRLLRSGGRLTTDHRQTLQTTLDWSYALLDAAGQAMLR